MRIVDSQVAMAAQHSYQQSQSSSLQIQIEHRSANAAAQQEQVSLSEKGKAQAAEEFDIDKAIENDPKMRLIRQLIEILTGHSFSPVKVKDGAQAANHAEQTPTDNTETPAAAENAPQHGAAINYQSVREESETVQFQAAGIIRTSDGREIEFSAELSMSRSFREEINFSTASGSLAREKKDPLVLNYDAPAATLSDSTFSFDIDADGQKDTISQLNQGSAYLALDLNKDGKVNDGRELFGTQSGNGFADLTRHDGDYNGWIDENDAIFSQLKLWIKDASGSDKLVDLASMGVGAIYLGSAKTDFDLNNAQNQTLGQTRATGIYLNEDGSGGTLQQLDLMV